MADADRREPERRTVTVRSAAVGALLLSTTLLLTACAPAVYRPDPEAFPPLTREIERAIDGSRECRAPALARKSRGADFRYGCFCGSDHPRIAIPDGGWARDYRAISAEQRREQVLDLYRVRPVDSIDLACRNHDICMLHKGSRAERCDRDFQDHLSAIQRYFFGEQLRRDELDSIPYRCDLLVEVLLEGLRADAEPNGQVGDLRLGDPEVRARLAPLLSERGSEFPRATERCVFERAEGEYQQPLGIQQRLPGR